MTHLSKMFWHVFHLWKKEVDCSGCACAETYHFDIVNIWMLLEHVRWSLQQQFSPKCFSFKGSIYASVHLNMSLRQAKIRKWTSLKFYLRFRDIRHLHTGKYILIQNQLLFTLFKSYCKICQNIIKLSSKNCIGVSAWHWWNSSVIFSALPSHSHSNIGHPVEMVWLGSKFWKMWLITTKR